MSKKTMTMCALLAAAAMALALVGCGGQQAKYPTRDITMTVPWNPGGSTDLTGRALAEPMGKFLKTKITVVNTPGAGGSAGTMAVMKAKKDGYSILANGFLAFCSQPFMGTIKTDVKDWDFYLGTFTPNIVAVRKDSPYKTFPDLLKAMKEKPGQITVGSAGPGSGGHIGIEVLKSATGIKYKHVAYGGGAPAIVATLSGEVDMNTQLLVEMQDMIKKGDIIALAAFTPEDIKIPGGPTIPSIIKFVPSLSAKLPMGETTGIAVPKGLPDNVLKQLDAAFADAIKDPGFTKFCNDRGFKILGINRGEESAKYITKLYSVVGWTLQDAGVAKVSPDTLKVPKP
jgi:tripartite-type tricarboxylate transporter receptor subunit TctC